MTTEVPAEPVVEEKGDVSCLSSPTREAGFFFAGEGGAADPALLERRASLLVEPPIALHRCATATENCDFRRRETTRRDRRPGVACRV